MLTKLIRQVFVLPIFLYQKLISPLFPSSCIYTPTCSSYAMQSIMKHGPLKGIALAVMRLLRCVGALFTGGEDPVPEHFSAAALTTPYRRFWRRRAGAGQ